MDLAEFVRAEDRERETEAAEDARGAVEAVHAHGGRRGARSRVVDHREPGWQSEADFVC
jgi:hypothetical protein